MIHRSTKQVTFTCDSPGCGFEDILQPVKDVDAEAKWLDDNEWEKGRFLFCPDCVRARNELRRLAA